MVALISLAITALSGWTLSAPAHAEDDDTTPLSVTMDSLTPSVVPRRGHVHVSGTVTNDSHDQWRNVRVYALISASPITDESDLADAVALDPAVEVGERVTTEGSFDVIDTLDPGQTARYALSVRRSDLQISGAPGVYWFGVHALGETDAGRDTLADGRARTFVPLIDDTTSALDTALVLPVRRPVEYDAQGALDDVPSWVADLRRSGSLEAVTTLGLAAGTRPLTWLVDPAVPDAAARLVAGNPGRSLAPDRRGGQEGTGSPSGDASDGPSGSPEPSSEPEDGAGSTDDKPTAAERAATSLSSTWLDRTRLAMQGDQVLALPYADLDVSSAAHHDPSTITEARRRSTQAIGSLEVTAGSAVAPASGYLDPGALAVLPRRTRVLLTEHALAGSGNSSDSDDSDGSGSAVAVVDGRRVVVTNDGAVGGGPGPGNRYDPLAMRQRLLSEAALALLDGQHALVASLPVDKVPVTDPASAAAFFAGLDVGWLHLTTLDTAVAAATPERRPDGLSYPAAQAAEGVPQANFTASNDLRHKGQLLDEVLPRNDSVGSAVTAQSLTAVSSWVREAPVYGVVAAQQAGREVQSALDSVTIAPPVSVTLSSDSGPFSATVTNGLDEMVRVKVIARTDPRLHIEPSDPVELGPGEHATVLLEAHTSLLGVHDVQLLVTDVDGNPIGPAATFPLRAAQVSSVIWVVIAVGAVLLVGAIAVRLFRRIRTHRTAGPGAGR